MTLTGAVRVSLIIYICTGSRTRVLPNTLPFLQKRPSHSLSQNTPTTTARHTPVCAPWWISNLRTLHTQFLHHDLTILSPTNIDALLRIVTSHISHS